MRITIAILKSMLLELDSLDYDYSGPSGLASGLRGRSNIDSFVCGKSFAIEYLKAGD